MGISRGYDGPGEVKYLFIDGACLRQIGQKFSDVFLDGREVQLNYQYVKGGYTKVFYYDAIYTQKENESDKEYEARIQPRVMELKSIRMFDGYHVYEGDVRRGGRKRGNEQKKVDVMIAVDMLTHTFRNNMHQASLLTNDLDFKPLIDALIYEGMQVELIYDAGWANNELISAADKKSPLTPLMLSRWIKNLSVDDRRQFIPQSSSSISFKPDRILLNWTDEKGLPRQISKQADLFHFHQANTQMGPNGYKYSNLEVLKKWVEAVEGIKIPQHT